MDLLERNKIKTKEMLGRKMFSDEDVNLYHGVRAAARGAEATYGPGAGAEYVGREIVSLKDFLRPIVQQAIKDGVEDAQKGRLPDPISMGIDSGDGLLVEPMVEYTDREKPTIEYVDLPKIDPEILKENIEAGIGLDSMSAHDLGLPQGTPLRFVLDANVDQIYSPDNLDDKVIDLIYGSNALGEDPETLRKAWSKLNTESPSQEE